ncbi:hypothetical protein ABLA30_18515 [Xenorhabdus nematophila]|uniref:hypothetical protein n=1 Tax=Xenorhabdus nematophila TaxID=628 RepID=UPI0032B76D82
MDCFSSATGGRSAGAGGIEPASDALVHGSLRRGTALHDRVRPGKPPAGAARGGGGKSGGRQADLPSGLLA